MLASKLTLAITKDRQMLQTLKYKTGYIHISVLNTGDEVIRAQVDRFAYTRQVKSLHAAKIMITKHKARAIVAVLP